jgi:hypothetical protein
MTAVKRGDVVLVLFPNSDVKLGQLADLKAVDAALRATLGL